MLLFPVCPADILVSVTAVVVSFESLIKYSLNEIKIQM